MSESNKSKGGRLDGEFDRATKFIHDREGFVPADLASDEVLPLVRATYKELSSAVEQGIADSSIRHQVPAVVRHNLLNDTWMFSGMKTYHELRQCAALLLDKEGHIKPFHKFRREVESINSAYNVRYLEVERQYAIGAAMMAAKWHDFEAAGDDKVRADHAELNGITLPIYDDFWDSYLHPSTGVADALPYRCWLTNTQYQTLRHL